MALTKTQAKFNICGALECLGVPYTFMWEAPEQVLTIDKSALTLRSVYDGIRVQVDGKLSPDVPSVSKPEVEEVHEAYRLLMESFEALGFRVYKTATSINIHSLDFSITSQTDGHVHLKAGDFLGLY